MRPRVRVLVRVVIALATLIVFSAFGSGGAGAVAMERVGAARAALAVPSAPFLENVTPVGLGVLVSWLPADPAEQVTSYAVSVAPAAGGNPPPAGCSGPFTVTVTAANSAARVSGLCIGVAYAATVAASNASGSGSPSAASRPVVALRAGVPSVPLITSVVARDQSLIVSWSPPGDDGGQPVTSYVLSAKPGNARVQVGGSVTQATLSGLTNGTAYTVSLVSTNLVGSSGPSTAKGVPRSAHAPAAPTDLAAVPDGSGSIVVSWTAPADDGGSPLTGFTVTYQQMIANQSNTGFVPAPGSSPQTVQVGASQASLSVSGFSLTNGLYAFSVAAVNGSGTGVSTAVSAPVSPQTLVTAKTVVLKAKTMAALGSGSGGVLFWPAPAPAQVAGLKVGQVLVAAPALAAVQGLLRVVRSIEQPTAGSYRVTTTPAALSDVFQSLALGKNINPVGGAGGGSFTPSAPGVRVVGSSSVSFSRSLTLGFDWKAGDQVGAFVSGEVSIEPELALELRLHHGWFGIPDGVGLTASARVTASASLSAGLTVKVERRKLGEITGDPIVVQVGPVPVVIVPRMPVYLDVNGKVGLTATASISVGGSVSWDSTNAGTLVTKNLSTPMTVKAGPLPGMSSTGTLSVDLSEEPQLDLYDLGGPGLTADERLDAEMNLSPPAGTPFLKVTPSLSVKAGLIFDFLGYHASLEQQIYSHSFTPFQILNPPAATLTIAPPNQNVIAGRSLQFSATRSDGTSHPISWTLIGAAGDTITSSGLFTAAAPAERTLTLVAIDDTGASGQTTITIGKYFDPPGNLTATQQSGTTDVLVTWTKPVNTGGSSLASYTITGDPGVPSTTDGAGTTSLTLKNLAPGAIYTISVYATNAAGLHSPPATTVISLTGGRTGPDPLWIAHYNGSFGSSVLLASVRDGSRLFVSGSSTDGQQATFATVAYDSAGTQLWGRRYNDRTASDEVEAVAASPDGSKVFVTGSSTPLDNPYNPGYLTVAYAGDTGERLWAKRLNIGGASVATATAVSPDGSRVFVTGSIPGTACCSTSNYLTIAYDTATGKPLWQTRHDGGGYTAEVPTAIAASPDGTRVIVTGAEGSSANPFRDYLTVAYDVRSGSQLWEQGKGDGTPTGAPAGLAISPDGSKVFATGGAEYPGPDDYQTVAYNVQTGEQLWQRNYDGPTGGDDIAVNLTVSPDGSRIFITGQSDGETGIRECATVAYASGTGALNWTERYDEADSRSNVCTAASVSPDGSRVFLTGSSSNGSNQHYLTLAYDGATGAPIWTATYSGLYGGFGTALAASPDGSKIFVTGLSAEGRSNYWDATTLAYPSR